MSFARLWAFLAVGLPVLAALIANLSSVDLAYHLRAGGEILDAGADPARRHVRRSPRAAPPWLDQQWGAQVILAAVYRLAGWTGSSLLRAAARRVCFGLLFVACRRRGARPPSRGVADARRVRRLAPSRSASGRSSSGWPCWRSTLLLVAVVAAHRPRLLWAVPVIVAGLGEHPRQLLPRPGRRSASPGSRTSTTARREPASNAASIAVVAAAGRPRQPVRARRLGATRRACRRTPWSRRGSASGSRRRCGPIPGILFFASALAVVVLLARRGRPTAWPTLAWLGVFFADRRLRDPGRGLVAAGSGRSPSRAARCPARSRRRQPAARPALIAPAEHRRRRG